MSKQPLIEQLRDIARQITEQEPGKEPGRFLLLVSTPVMEGGEEFLDGDLLTAGSPHEIAIMADMMIDGLTSPELCDNEEVRNTVTGAVSARLIENKFGDSTEEE